MIISTYEKAQKTSIWQKPLFAKPKDKWQTGKKLFLTLSTKGLIFVLYKNSPKMIEKKTQHPRRRIGKRYDSFPEKDTNGSYTSEKMFIPLITQNVSQKYLQVLFFTHQIVVRYCWKVCSEIWYYRCGKVWENVRFHDRVPFTNCCLDQFAALRCVEVLSMLTLSVNELSIRPSVLVASDDKGFLCIPRANLSDKTKLLQTESLCH